jgi:hypothetical protein
VDSVNGDGGRSDGISQNLAKFMDGLNPKEKEELVTALRDSKFYLAENIDDVLAILNGLGR